LGMAQGGGAAGKDRAALRKEGRGSASNSAKGKPLESIT